MIPRAFGFETGVKVFSMKQTEYERYLASSHWLLFSSDIKNKRSECENCGIGREEARQKYRQDLNVHHKNYRCLGHESAEDVAVLCHRCHSDFHWGVTEDFRKLLERYKFPPVLSCPLYCLNCGARSDFVIFNSDEKEPYICPDCS